jgi:hypothetical protein
MRMPFALPALLAVAACAESAANNNTGTSTNNRAPELSDRWLIGGWVPEGESCESDAGMVFDADHSWASEGTSGTWSIEGRTIVTVATQRDDGESGMQNIAAERSVQQVQEVSREGFVSRLEDGTVIRWGRCSETTR